MSDNFIHDPMRKGRGAISNKAGRFEKETKAKEADGWQQAGEEPELDSTTTEIYIDKSRSIISKNQSPDIAFNQSLNSYRGCEHGCIYCFARPTHAYLGHSTGLDFETKLYAKPDAALLLRKEISKRNYKPDVIALGSNTDPYQPIEKRFKITRSVLEVLSEFNHPVAITTKSARILDDIEILADMAKRQLVSVYISVTTLDSYLARIMEPRASTPARRLLAIKQLTTAGIPTGISLSPIIPAINDMEIEDILAAGKDAGAINAFWILLRLASELKDLFEEWLAAHFPDRKEKVLSLLKQCHGGKLYQSNFMERMRGNGPYAALIKARFHLASKKLGLNNHKSSLNIDQFQQPKIEPTQPDLFK